MRNTLTIFAALFILSCGIAGAWGNTGHAIVANIAENNLRPEVREKIDRILEGRSMVYYSAYLDMFKQELLMDPEDGFGKRIITHVFLYDTTKGEVTSQTDPSVAQPGEKVLLTFLGHSIKQLTERQGQMDKEEMLLHMMTVIHLMGDLHCPAHAVLTPLPETWKANSGMSINIMLDGKKSWFHSFWDGQIFYKFYPFSYQELAQMFNVFSSEQLQAMQEGGLVDWAQETASVTVRMKDLKEGYVWTTEDFRTYEPEAERLLVAAGMRLAKIMNEIFAK